MAIQVNGTTVINNSRQLTNIASIDATTAAAISAAGVGAGGWSLEQTSTISSKTGIAGIGTLNLSNAFSYTFPSGTKAAAISFTVGSTVRNYGSGGTQSTGLVLGYGGSSISTNTFVAASPSNWSSGTATYYGQEATVSTVATANGYDGLNQVEKQSWSNGFRAYDADPNYSPHEYGANTSTTWPADAGSTIYYTVTPWSAGSPGFSEYVTVNNVTIKVWVLS